MKKNTKLLIGAGFAVILLGAALTTVLLLPSEKDKISENDNQAVVLYDGDIVIGGGTIQYSI